MWINLNQVHFKFVLYYIVKCAYFVLRILTLKGVCLD